MMTGKLRTKHTRTSSSTGPLMPLGDGKIDGTALFLDFESNREQGDESRQDKCAERKLKLIEFVKANGGDADKVEREITVTCKQRMEGNTEGGIDYYFHSSDGKRYRSNKEVCKKFLGINEFVSPPKKAKTK